MNLKRNIQYSVRFKAVSEGAVWVVYAFGVWHDGNRVVRISSPRIVQIVPKETPVLTGTVSAPETPLLENARIRSNPGTEKGTPSPYVNPFIAFSNQALAWYNARPPTQSL